MRLRAVLVLFLFTCICTKIYGNKKCYFAKTCIHDGKEKCGEDAKGKVRRFLDSCDIKEYNCLKGTDYKKTSLENCESLPPIEDLQLKTTLPTQNTSGKFKGQSEGKSSTKATTEQETSDDHENISQQVNSKEKTEDMRTTKHEIDSEESSPVKESFEKPEVTDAVNVKNQEQQNNVTKSKKSEVNDEESHDSGDK